MTLRPALCLALVLFLFPVAAVAAEDADIVERDPVLAVLDRLSEKEQSKLESGKVVFVSEAAKAEDGSDAGIGWAVGIVDAPPEKVWGVLVDYANFPEFMPRVTAVEKYEIQGEKGKEGWFGLAMTLKILFRGMEYNIRQKNDRENLTIVWEKDPNKEDDFSKNDGHWVLRPHGDGQTLAFYTIDVVTTRRIPQALQNFLLKRDLPNVVEALQERVAVVD